VVGGHGADGGDREDEQLAREDRGAVPVEQAIERPPRRPGRLRPDPPQHRHAGTGGRDRERDAREPEQEIERIEGPPRHEAKV
jgi:hypothetical protein